MGDYTYRVRAAIDMWEEKGIKLERVKTIARNYELYIINMIMYRQACLALNIIYFFLVSIGKEMEDGFSKRRVQRGVILGGEKKKAKR